MHAAQLHALDADLTQHPQRPPDVGDARVGDLLLAERLGGDQRQQQAPVLDDHVVDLFDEMAGQFVFVGLLGNERLPLQRELVDDARERKYQRLPEQSGLGAEMPEE